MTMEILAEAGRTSWHWLGPWTGYYIGITATLLLIWLNKKI